MKPFCLLLVAVVVGWAAFGVDWSREAEGQDRVAVDEAVGKQSLCGDGLDQMGRYVPIADAAGESSGCFIVDSITGRTWHASSGYGIRELPQR